MEIKDAIESIMKLRDETGCWNVDHDNKYGPKLTHYVPNYKSTLWTLILLADLEADRDDERVKPSLKIITEHFWDEKNGIFTIGKSHFPIPCLNGNMIYLIKYFNFEADDKIGRVIEFFNQYQRFDDGDYATPKEYPYFKNRSCYGKHTCYWGVVKLLKGLSFIPETERSDNAITLLNSCINFILKHQVCYSSKNPESFLHPMICRLTFPNMYKADFLEILWILKRINIKPDRANRAIDLLRSKQKPDGTWELERQIKNLAISITKKRCGNELITQRAEKVLSFLNQNKKSTYKKVWITIRN